MYRRMMRISWKDHRTNNSILEELKPICHFLAEVKRRKLQYFGHVVRAENLSTRVLHGRIARNRGRGRPRRRWTDDIKQWTGRSVAECVQCAADRSNWRSVVSVSATFDPRKWERTKARQGPKIGIGTWQTPRDGQTDRQTELPLLIRAMLSREKMYSKHFVIIIYISTWLCLMTLPCTGLYM